MQPVVEEIVRKHYDPDVSLKAGHAVFLVKAHSRDVNHTVEMLNINEFAHWLKKHYGLKGTVAEIATEIRWIFLLPLPPPPRVDTQVRGRFRSFFRTIFSA